MISALYPFPGSKQKSKYDRVLFAPLDCTHICEPFMGAATRSLLNPRLSPVLGEINAAQRAIALCLGDPQGYREGYRWAIEQFWGWTNGKGLVLRHQGAENAQAAIKHAHPNLYGMLSKNWKALMEWLFNADTTESMLPGVYAFCIRAAFGNVLRLSPSGTHFNVSWHVDKLANAMQHDPDEFIASLQRQRWNPTVLPDWQSAIAHVENPHTTWCLLDPPYWVDGKEEKATPCYPFHGIGTKGEHLETLRLATDSLQCAIDREFSVITVCNYYNDFLDDFVKSVAGAYLVHSILMGECNALGNSNGRRKHGQRVDQRKRPIEVIYRLEFNKKKTFWFPVTKQLQSEQLSMRF